MFAQSKMSKRLNFFNFVQRIFPVSESGVITYVTKITFMLKKILIKLF